MKKYILIIGVSSVLLSGCSMFRPNYTEREQVKYQAKSKGESYSLEIRSPVIVKAEVLKEFVYQGGFSSADTWPHQRFILKIKEGRLPQNKRARKFEYHTAYLGTPIAVGDTLTFIFDQDGNFYEIQEIEPNPPVTIESSKD